MTVADQLFGQVHRRPHHLAGGTTALAATGLGYAVCVLLLGVAGAAPGSPPWLPISAKWYFYWEATFIGPVIFLGGILAAGVMHLLAKLAGGDGAFDDTFSSIGTAIGIATLFTLVPDLVVAGLLLTGRMAVSDWMWGITHPSGILALVWSYLLLYLAAFLVLFPSVARRCYGLGRWRANAVGTLTFAVYQAFLYVFVR